MSIMNRNDIELLLSHIEGLQKFLEGNTLEGFRQEILRVEKFLSRFGTLDELIGYIEKIEKIAYVAKDFLSISEVADFLQISKSTVYKLTASKEITVYKPTGKNIFILRSDLNKWIRRYPHLSNDDIIKMQILSKHRLQKNPSLNIIKTKTDDTPRYGNAQ